LNWRANLKREINFIKIKRWNHQKEWGPN
jgi:hypothetical protein